MKISFFILSFWYFYYIFVSWILNEDLHLYSFLLIFLLYLCFMNLKWRFHFYSFLLIFLLYLYFMNFKWRFHFYSFLLIFLLYLCFMNTKWRFHLFWISIILKAHLSILKMCFIFLYIHYKFCSFWFII